MFLQQLPDAVRWAVLFLAGACIGSLINLAIYRLAMFQPRNISPWSPADDGKPPRTWIDRIPIVGWFPMRRESDQHGRGFWVRPMLIEVATAVGLAWFYEWQTGGALFGIDPSKLADKQVEVAATWNQCWFLFHATLFALLAVATFIDFDEQTIPDWVTIPGTVFALFCMALFPWLRLPIHEAGMGKLQLGFLNYWTPDSANQWFSSHWGLITAIAIILIWCFALTPKWATMRWGLLRGIRIMLASIRRRKRATKGQVPRIKERSMLIETKILIVLAIVMTAFVAITYSVGGDHWLALMDSLLGLAMGGGIIWAVRIIAGQALGVEAMGFGDVTLMCMIGAFLGWQPALLVFAIAPFTSIVVALALVIGRGENRLAFGPYLCIAALIVVIKWDFVWNDWATMGVFSLGGKFLLVVIAVCLVLMAVMLGVWGKFKYRD